MFLFKEGFSLEINKLSRIRTSNCKGPLAKIEISWYEMGYPLCLLCMSTLERVHRVH